MLFITKNEKLLFFATVALATACLLTISAVPYAYANTDSTTKDVLKETKDSVDEFVIAQDKEDPVRDLSFRINAFKNVIELSIKEARDTRVKLLTSDELDGLKSENESISEWENESLEKINNSINYFREKRDFIENNENDFDIESVQSLAIEFKDWRKENYLPVHEAVNNLLLILKGDKIIKIADNRWEKIEKDINSLENAEIINESSELFEMLNKSKSLIEAGKEDNNSAFDTFFETYIKTEISEEETVSDISQEKTEPGEKVYEEVEVKTTENNDDAEAKKNETATTTEKVVEQPDNTEHETVPGKMEQLSINDLVWSSLSNIREAYEVFIEMSNFVRKLLI